MTGMRSDAGFQMFERTFRRVAAQLHARAMTGAGLHYLRFLCLNVGVFVVDRHVWNGVRRCLYMFEPSFRRLADQLRARTTPGPGLHYLRPLCPNFGAFVVHRNDW
eukprot:2555084-Lingulodinium_polyedra.AAC.1